MLHTGRRSADDGDVKTTASIFAQPTVLAIACFVALGCGGQPSDTGTSNGGAGGGAGAGGTGPTSSGGTGGTNGKAPVGKLGDVGGVASGYHTHFAIKKDASVVAWGAAPYG